MGLTLSVLLGLVSAQGYCSGGGRQGGIGDWSCVLMASEQWTGSRSWRLVAFGRGTFVGGVVGCEEVAGTQDCTWRCSAVAVVTTFSRPWSPNTTRVQRDMTPVGTVHVGPIPGPRGASATSHSWPAAASRELRG